MYLHKQNIKTNTPRKKNKQNKQNKTKSPKTKQTTTNPKQPKQDTKLKTNSKENKYYKTFWTCAFSVCAFAL